MKNIKILEAREYNNIKEMIYGCAEDYNDKSAFIIKKKDEEGNIAYIEKSYKKLLEDINCFGTALYSLGLKNKRVAVMGKNRYEWLVAHLGNLLGSIVSVPLDKDLQLEELENSLIRSEVEAIVFDNKLIGLMDKIKENNKTNVKTFIAMDQADGYENVEALVKKGNEIIQSGNKEYIENEIDSDAMGVLLFTSGTTSASKAVMLTQRGIASNIYALQCVEDFRKTDVNMAFLPFHHIFGSTCILFVMACGVKTAFPDGLRYIKQNMQEYKVSVFVGVPVLIEAMYKAVLKEVEKQGKTRLIKIAVKISDFLLKLKIDVRRKLFKQVLDGLGGELRLIVSGGAPVDTIAMKGFTSIGIETLNGYGLSETSPVIAAESYFVRKVGSVGSPMLNNKVEIVDKDENGIGEIRVKGPNVMLGYYGMPELTNEVLKDGWFYTGDLGYFDKDGCLFITGRNKNMIVLKNGKKVFPEEIETIINRIDLVGECMAFGLQDKKDKNDITLSIKVVYDEEVIKEKYSDKSEDELREIVWGKIKEANKTFPRYKHIQNLITSHEELIKTTTKKVKRNEEMKKILNEKSN